MQKKLLLNSRQSA